ncbi:MAG: hypothetical protein ACXWQO_12670 [Bdellovibrionota bacterium]
MANLDAAKKKEFNNSLSAAKTPWILFGIDASLASLAERMEGIAGLIDWSLHGQVSQLLARAKFPADGFCVVPGDPSCERPSFLAFQFGPHPDVKSAAERLHKLGIKDVSVAETTFPEDFCRKLKQTLTKEGSRWTKLES